MAIVKPRVRPTSLVIRLLGIVFSLQLTCVTSAAESDAAEPTLPLRPFEAVYKTSALGMTLDLTRSLTLTDDTYTLASSGKNFLIKMDETAKFRVSNGRIEGVKFDSTVKSLRTNNRSVRFDKASGTIDSMKRGDWTQHPWESDVLDRFSQQQQLRLTLIDAEKPPEILEFRVVDGPKVSKKRWQRQPDEVIETPLGQISTIKYRAVHTNPDKRASEIWLAPALDYLMVKTLHVERSSTVKVSIASLKWLDGA